MILYANQCNYHNLADPQAAGPRVDRAVGDLPPPQNMPVWMDIASIGQSTKYRPHITHLDVSIPLFPVWLDLVSIRQSMNYHHRRPFWTISLPMFPYCWNSCRSDSR